MEKFKLFSFCIQILLVNIVLCSHYSKAALPQFENLETNQRLYNGNDNVTVLNAATFKSNVYGSNRLWLVHFYDQRCHLCIRFAPTWKSFADDIFQWKDVVEVAAMDCSDDENNKICREKYVTDYPRTKYFHANSSPSTLGEVFREDIRINILKHNLVDILIKEQREGRGSTWPKITTYRNSKVLDMRRDLFPTIEHFFLLFDNDDSHLGPELILDLHKVPNIQIRRVLSNNKPLRVTNYIEKFPSIVAFDQPGNKRVINIETPSKENVLKAIRDYLTEMGIDLNEILAKAERHS